MIPIISWELWYRITLKLFVRAYWRIIVLCATKQVEKNIFISAKLAQNLVKHCYKAFLLKIYEIFITCFKWMSTKRFIYIVEGRKTIRLCFKNCYIVMISEAFIILQKFSFVNKIWAIFFKMYSSLGEKIQKYWTVLYNAKI